MNRNPNQDREIIHVGIAEALAEINLNLLTEFEQDEARLAKTMQPARLAPVHPGRRNGKAASPEVIEEIRRKYCS